MHPVPETLRRAFGRDASQRSRGSGVVNCKLLTYPKLQLLQSIWGGGCRGRQRGDRTNWAGGGKRDRKGSRMNNSQPGFNDLSGRAAFLMSGVKEADPGGKRVQVYVVQLGVSVCFCFFSSGIAAYLRRNATRLSDATASLM